jgi:DNA-binding NtrC family response regulator
MGNASPSEPSVLLVEDHDDIRELMAEDLTNYGFRIWAVHDGEAAIEFLAREMGRIDVVITDVLMTNKTGFDVYKFIQDAKSKPKPIVMFFSALDEQSFPEKVPDDVTFVQKPCTMRALVDYLKSALEERISLA